jgi:aminopeptidase N
MTAVTESEAKARSALIEVESYTVALDFTAGPDTVGSHTEIRFRCREPGAATFADLAADTVRRVVLNGTSLDPAGLLAGERLHLAGLAADNALTVDAEFGYTTDSRALSRWADPAGGAVYVMVTCFPAFAPAVFCCFDQPDLRANVTLSVTAPPGWECQANAPVTSRPAPGAAGLWEFAPARKMHTYDLALCAGPYLAVAEEELAGVDGPIRLRVWCRPRLATEPGLRRVGSVVGRALRYYEELLGVACPYRELNLVFPPDLAPLAMQVPALTTVSESLLQRAADPQDHQVLVILAHEVAHVWFGCMVESSWWDDLWLAESMATYLSLLAADEALSLGAVWAEFATTDKALTYQVDSVPGTPPVSSPVTDASDALSKPYAITYVKGASAIRQLAALIGDEALRTGLREYLTRYAWGCATLADLVDCWGRASGRDLAGWAREWLRTAGVNTLRPELALAPDGTIGSLAVVQDASPAPRTHRVAAGLYARQDDGRLRRHRVASVEISGDRTEVAGLAGAAAPDAVVLNDGDLTLARIRFDAASWRALSACALDVGDPLTEAVLWNAAWDMTKAAELTAAEFTGLVARRIAAEAPPAGLQALLDQAVTAADFYAPPAQRAGLRERLAAACLDGAGLDGAGLDGAGLTARGLAAAGPDGDGLARPGGRAQRVLAGGFAAAAQTDDQLARLRAWLGGTAHPDGTGLPEGLELNLELRGRILAALSAHGLATDADLDAYVADDPVGGERQRATCRARRPDPAAKEAAWAATLAPGQPIHLARAHAEGVWVPGQENLMAPFRTRFFTEVLPALGQHQPRIAGRLAGLLYPVTLAEQDTIAATDAALDRGGFSEPVRLVLLEARITAERIRAARARSVR